MCPVDRCSSKLFLECVCCSLPGESGNSTWVLPSLVSLGSALGRWGTDSPLLLNVSRERDGGSQRLPSCSRPSRAGPCHFTFCAKQHLDNSQPCQGVWETLCWAGAPRPKCPSLQPSIPSCQGDIPMALAQLLNRKSLSLSDGQPLHLALPPAPFPGEHRRLWLMRPP